MPPYKRRGNKPEPIGLMTAAGQKGYEFQQAPGLPYNKHVSGALHA